MVLPPEARRIHCLGADDTLTAVLREVGYEVEESPLPEGPGGRLAFGGDASPDAVLISADPARVASAMPAVASALGPAGVVAAPVAGGERTAPRPMHRALRALQIGISPLVAVAVSRTASQLMRAMEDAGLAASRFATGDRVRVRYGIGPGGWLRRGRVPVGWIVVGRSGASRDTIFEVAAREAGQALGGALEARAANVYETGKLGVELVDRGGSVYFLSIAALETSAGLGRSEAVLRALLAGDPPTAVRHRIMGPLATGSVGAVRYVLEPYAAGRHLTWMTPRLWDECLEFLDALHHWPEQERGSPELGEPWPAFDEAAEFLASHLPATERRGFERAAAEVATRIEGLPRGVGHGDFWGKNLIERRGGLHAVLDWEWACRGALPLLDLLDLKAQLGLRSRGLPPGPNFLDVLAPLADRGGDEHVRRLCEATGTPNDRATLKGLTVAHWMLRSARAGMIRPLRLEDRHWVEANLLAPTARLEQTLASNASPTSGTPARPSADGRSPRSRRAVAGDTVVLGYHAVSEDWPAQLSVSPAQFEGQLRVLAAHGYRGVTFSQAVRASPDERVVAITFDDAYRSVLTLARPILDELAMPATVFVPTVFPDRGEPMSWTGIDHWLGGPHEQELVPMSWDELAELAAAGWEIGSHSRTHPRLTELDDDALARELGDSRRECEARLGMPCGTLAYPYGDEDERVIRAAAAAGYEAACTFSTRLNAPAPLRWPRIGIHRRDYPSRFRLKLWRPMRSLRTARGWEVLRGMDPRKERS